MDHMGANLAVVNFNMPALQESGAGETILQKGIFGPADDARVTFGAKLNESLGIYRKIGVKFDGISAANLRAYAYREFYAGQFKECIHNQAGVLDASWGQCSNRDLMTIRESSSMTMLNFEAAYLHITEIIGITWQK